MKFFSWSCYTVEWIVTQRRKDPTINPVTFKVQMSAAESMDQDIGIDDIFGLLKEATSSGTTHADNNSKNTNKNLTYEELKKKVTHLPSIELKLFTEKSQKDVSKKKSRDIQKINDSVESVLPDPKKRTITDRRVIKEENSRKWFALPKVEMTDEIKRDLLVIKNRKYLDPKRFYKGEKWEIPENFQMGEIVEGVGEYAGRIKRKNRGKTLVDELLKNENHTEWFNKTYNDIQTKKRGSGKISKRKRL